MNTEQHNEKKSIIQSHTTFSTLLDFLCDRVHRFSLHNFSGCIIHATEARTEAKFIPTRTSPPRFPLQSPLCFFHFCSFGDDRRFGTLLRGVDFASPVLLGDVCDSNIDFASCASGKRVQNAMPVHVRERPAVSKINRKLLFFHFLRVQFKSTRKRSALPTLCQRFASVCSV